MMKKLILLLTGIFILTGCAQIQTPNATTESQKTGMISEADAKVIALEKAGLETATFTEQHYDAEDVEYEFEFHTDTTEYECEVDARTGTIKNFDSEPIHDLR